MKFILISLVLFLSTSAFAGKMTVGPMKDGSGNQLFEVQGCTTLTNLTGNIDDFTVTPKMSRDEWIVICGNFRYEEASLLVVFEKIAEKAKAANCFDSKIDKVNKTIELVYLSGDKVVTEISESKRTYTLDGYEPYVDMDKKERVRHLCVLDKEALEWPYDELLKK